MEPRDYGPFSYEPISQGPVAEGAQSGRVMAICLHPYLIGVPHRIQGLDDAVSYVAAHGGVWFATGSEIVDAWKQTGATF